jgi:putative heme-binding domain-containing protein
MNRILQVPKTILASFACAALLGCFPVQLAAQTAGESPLNALVQVLNQTDDAQFQRDILKGMSQGLQGRRSVPMPAGWEQVETQLGASPNAEIRALVQALSLTFGSSKALDELRRTLRNPTADTNLRQSALQSLLGVRDIGLPPILTSLLAEPELRGAALRALAAYEHAETPAAVLEVYPSLSVTEKRDALNTLASRPAYATRLLSAVENEVVAPQDLTADLIRQLRNLKSDEVDQLLTAVWGVARDTTPDMQQEIDRYKRIYRAGGSQPGDAVNGRVLYAQLCQQCHILFDVGGTVGPDLTGSNRGDLDYILQNMVDPNAVIPNDYRTSMIETEDGRVITGIIKKQDANAVTIMTANDTLIVPRNEIILVEQSELSMMPEGLLEQLNDQEVRDLIYYLGRPAQVPLKATQETAPFFFNETDLTNWDGNLDLWSVQDGEIVGNAPKGLKENEFLKSQMLLDNFRLIVQVKLTPNNGNSGIQFRSEALPNGDVKGYQADIGAGWWGKLYEEHGRGLIWDKSGDSFVKQGDWNIYEILAVGSKIRTAINGNLCVDLDDSQGARQGITALQLHSGGPMEIRFKDFQLEINPKPELKTVKR